MSKKEFIKESDIKCKEISYRRYWIIHNLRFLTDIKIISNPIYGIIYKYLFTHFNLETGELRMTNEQIKDNINKNLQQAHKTNIRNITVNEIARAIARLEKVISKGNDKPYMMRKRYSSYGKKSMMILNKDVLPPNNYLRKTVVIAKKKLNVYEKRIEKLIEDSDKLQTKEDELRKKLYEIYDKLSQIKKKRISINNNIQELNRKDDLYGD